MTFEEAKERLNILISEINNINTTKNEKNEKIKEAQHIILAIEDEINDILKILNRLNSHDKPITNNDNKFKLRNFISPKAAIAGLIVGAIIEAAEHIDKTYGGGE